MLTGTAVLIVAALAVATLGVKGWRDHRDLISLRGHMLDDCAGLLDRPIINIGPDSFPILTGWLDDGRHARVELIADTLVVRRLPQLWLRVTVLDDVPRRAFSIGALARMTGTEFYSIVTEMPDRHPAPANLSIIVRGDRVPGEVERRGQGLLAHLFSDPRLKDAVATPRGIRIVRQVSEGDRASHLVLRQVRFGVDAVPSSTLRLALDDALRMGSGMVETNRAPETSIA